MGMLANTQYYCLLKRLVTSSDVGWAGRIGLTASWCANHLVCPEILYPPRIPMVSCAVPCSGGCWTCLWSAYHGIYIYIQYIYIQYIYIHIHIYIHTHYTMFGQSHICHDSMTCLDGHGMWCIGSQHWKHLGDGHRVSFWDIFGWQQMVNITYPHWTPLSENLLIR